MKRIKTNEIIYNDIATGKTDTIFMQDEKFSIGEKIAIESNRETIFRTVNKISSAGQISILILKR